MPVLIWLLSESLGAATHASETVLILIWIHKARPCNTSFHFCLNIIFSTCLSDHKRTAWEGPSGNTICLSNQQQSIQGELPQTHSLLHRYPALVQPTDHEKSTPWPAKPQQPPSTNPPSGSQMGQTIQMGHIKATGQQQAGTLCDRTSPPISLFPESQHPDASLKFPELVFGLETRASNTRHAPACPWTPRIQPSSRTWQ